MGGHIATSGCPSLLQSLGDTFFIELPVVKNPGFAVGTRRYLSYFVFEVTVSEIAMADSPRIAVEKKQFSVSLSKRLEVFFSPRRAAGARMEIEA